MKTCIYCSHPVDTDDKTGSWLYAIIENEQVSMSHAECAQMIDDIIITEPVEF